jgi:hypothetical protein
VAADGRCHVGRVTTQSRRVPQRAFPILGSSHLVACAPFAVQPSPEPPAPPRARARTHKEGIAGAAGTGLGLTLAPERHRRLRACAAPPASCPAGRAWLCSKPKGAFRRLSFHS